MGKIVYSSLCEKGLVRENNQDAVYTDVRGRNGIFCIADGMGGHEKGEIASGIIVTRVEEAWNRFFTDKKKKDFRSLFNEISNAVKTANREIYEDHNKNAVCGSTVVALLIYGNNYGVISVGDSRLYLFRKNREPEQITVDDVWENLPEQKGKPVNELRRSPKFGKLTNAVGTMRDVRINYQLGKIRRSATYMLCSDGLYKMCSDPDMNEIVKAHYKEPEVINELLREKVFAAGAKDNLSIITANVHVSGLLFGKGEVIKSDSLHAGNETTEKIADRIVEND